MARKQRRRTGATLVETAVVIPVTLLLIFGIIEFGRLLLVIHLANHAVREAGRVAVVSTGLPDNEMSTDDIKDRARAAMCGLDSNLNGFEVRVYKADYNGANIGGWKTAGFTERIAVEITGDFEPVLPSFLNLAPAIPVHAMVLMNSEANNG
jgi:Flp pilus assembly protein TadG